MRLEIFHPVSVKNQRFAVIAERLPKRLSALRAKLHIFLACVTGLADSRLAP
ncbi:MAG: hypothetical protein ACTXOO_03620 [Sodalis sp. (in: enterobacteria)]